jgi:tetratricopeptide (TPR) repeat protein
MPTPKTTVITRKDMKEPDKFQVAATQAATWMASRKQQVLAAGAVAVAILVALAVFSAAQAKKTAAAGAASASLLAAAGGTISSVPIPGEAGPFFPDEQARQRAILDAANKVIAEYPGTDAAALAALLKGDAQYKLRDLDAAAQSYEAYLREAGKDSSLRFGALEGLALVAEAKGDLDGAAKAYARMAQEAPAFGDRAELERARVLTQAGKTAEAKELLAGFGEKHKDSMLTPEATQRLAKLGGK